MKESKHIAKLQYITQDLPGMTHSELAQEMGLAGVKWIQLRLKNKPQSACKTIASKVQAICKKAGATFIINDFPILAKEVEADGVHLGKNDMSISQARKILGDKSIIGGTANTLKDMLELTNKGVDYIGLGPFRTTTTKKKLSPLLGLDGIKYLMDEYAKTPDKKPVIAVGGICVEDVRDLISTGIHGIAVASAINGNKNKNEAAKHFRDCFSLTPSL